MRALLVWLIATPIVVPCVQGQDAMELGGHTGVVTSLAFSPDKHLLASAGTDGSIRLWNADGSLERVLKLDHQYVMCVSFSGTGEVLGAGSLDGNVILWDTSTWRRLATMASYSLRVALTKRSGCGRCPFVLGNARF